MRRADGRETGRDEASETVCDTARGGEYPEQVLRFVARFDRGDYWLAHEELEDLWLEERLDLYKGLIQVAAAFVHVGRCNWNGAIKLFRSALGLLNEYPAQEQGFDLDAVRTRVVVVLGHVEGLKRAGSRRFDEAYRFPMRPHFAGTVRPDLVEDAELPYRVRRHEDRLHD